MSGGSHNYICYRIEEDLVGQMEDKELDDLMRDISATEALLMMMFSQGTVARVASVV